MAIGGRKKTVEIDFIADTTKATRGIKQVGDTAETEGTKLQKMGDKAKLGFAAAAVGVGIAVDFLKDAALAAAEDERAQADLALALKNTVKATDDQIEATEEWIKKTSLATGVADDELRPALEALTRATGDLDEAQDLLAIAMDISAATGKPLQGVIDAMSKAIQNNSIGALGRLGLKVKDVEGNFLTFDEVMQEAQRTMGGAMETAAETGAGSIARMEVAFGEAKEALGAELLPILIEAADALTTFFEIIESEAPPTGDKLGLFTDDLYDIAHWYEDPAIKGIADFFGITLPGAADKSKNRIEAMSSGARSAMEEVIPVLDKVEDGQEDLTEAVETTTDAYYDQLDATKALHDPVFALYEAQQNVAEANANVTKAAEEFGEGTPEWVAAVGQARDAHYRLRDAEQAVAEQAPVTAESLRLELQRMGIFTAEAIDAIIAEFERVNAFRFRIPSSVRDVRHITGGGPQAHVGGVIPGDFPGQEVMVQARAGERFGSSVPSNGNGHGQTAVIQFNVDGRTLFEQVVLPEMVRYRKRNGSI